MKQVNQIRLFISCASDVKEELDSIRVIIDEINKTSGKQNLYTIESLNWTVDTYTQIGDDPQDVINSQLSEYDILIGLFWQRIGIPTKRDKSGTIEEINRAMVDGRQLLIYFNTAPPESLNHINLDHLSQINQFKTELSQKGLLYKEYNSIASFESLFRINIINLIADRFLSNKNELQQISHDKYAFVYDIFNKIEERNRSTVDDLGLFDLTDKVAIALNVVTSSIVSVGVSVQELTTKMQNRSKELNRTNAIKDNRLRVKKAQIIVDQFAKELDKFSTEVNNEIDKFSESFLEIGPMYSKILGLAFSFEKNTEIELRKSLMGLRDRTEEAMISCASMLHEVSLWPPVSTEFNKSKRTTEETLKRFTKELLDGLKLLDEAIK